MKPPEDASHVGPLRMLERAGLIKEPGELFRPSNQNLWVKPEKFGDSDRIYLAQHKVNTYTQATLSYYIVGGHVLVTEHLSWTPGFGECHCVVSLTNAPAGLPLNDETLPIGTLVRTPVPEPHVPEKIKRFKGGGGYPGALSIFTSLFGSHGWDQTLAFCAFTRYCRERGRNEASGAWSSQFYELVRAVWAGHVVWDAAGASHGNFTQRLRPMVAFLREVREAWRADSELAEAAHALSIRYLHPMDPSRPERFYVVVCQTQEGGLVDIPVWEKGRVEIPDGKVAWFKEAFPSRVPDPGEPVWVAEAVQRRFG